MNYRNYVPRNICRDKEMKVCSKCGKRKLLREFYYHRARRVYMASCKKCNDERVIRYYKENKHTNPKTVFQMRAGHIYRTCRIRKIPYDFGLGSYLLKLWEDQKEKCFYTGLPMSLTGYHTDKMAVTVDRIVPEKGYVKGNIVLGCSIANRMKQNLTYDDLLLFCQSLLDHKKNVKDALTSMGKAV